MFVLFEPGYVRKLKGLTVFVSPDVMTLEWRKGRKDGGPSFISFYSNGARMIAWTKNGRSHRTRGPAIVVYRDEKTHLEWWKNGEFIRERDLDGVVLRIEEDM